MLVNDVVFKEGLTAVLHKEERGGEGGGEGRYAMNGDGR